MSKITVLIQKSVKRFMTKDIKTDGILALIEIDRSVAKMENKMEQVAAMFGKKLGERFTVKRDDMVFDCRFTKYGLDTFGVYENPYMSLDVFILEELLTGRTLISDD